MKQQGDTTFMLLTMLYQTTHCSCVRQACTSVVVSENLSCPLSDVFVPRTNVKIQISLWLDLAIRKLSRQ